MVFRIEFEYHRKIIVTSPKGLAGLVPKIRCALRSPACGPKVVQARRKTSEASLSSYPLTALAETPSHWPFQSTCDRAKIWQSETEGTRLWTMAGDASTVARLKASEAHRDSPESSALGE